MPLTLFTGMFLPYPLQILLLDKIFILCYGKHKFGSFLGASMSLSSAFSDSQKEPAKEHPRERQQVIILGEMGNLISSIASTITNYDANIENIDCLQRQNDHFLMIKKGEIAASDEDLAKDRRFILAAKFVGGLGGAVFGAGAGAAALLAAPALTVLALASGITEARDPVEGMGALAFAGIATPLALLAYTTVPVWAPIVCGAAGVAGAVYCAYKGYSYAAEKAADHISPDRHTLREEYTALEEESQRLQDLHLKTARTKPSWTNKTLHDLETIKDKIVAENLGRDFQAVANIANLLIPVIGREGSRKFIQEVEGRLRPTGDGFCLHPSL